MDFTPLYRDWMNADRGTLYYRDGVDSFLQFAKDHLGDIDWYCCPCINCRNVKGKKTSAIIREHLICDGIDKSYKIWYAHGEPLPERYFEEDRAASSRRTYYSRRNTLGMVDMVNDVFGGIYSDEMDADVSEHNDEAPDNIQADNTQDPGYSKLLADAIQPLYPSCRVEHTKLSVIIELLSMKSTHSWSDKSFTALLKIMKKILPDQNCLPENTYSAKKMVKDLRMEYQIIHACRNDCILYWKEYANNESCPTCGESRWKPRKETNIKSKRLPWKKLRYFPITPRLQRLYSVPWIAEQMTWHSSVRDNNTHMRHPMDSVQWKTINRRWVDFASEKRNIRLGLATDGFNPFGNKNNSYSCWPVMIVPYNLPPSLCMRKEFTVLALLIPGKKGPGHDIDVYMQPLIAELKELWSIGVNTYDAYTRHRFMMKAILMWAIHDFPAYGHLSGCRTAGKHGCPVCSEGTESVWLSNGNKFAYMGHRRFLVDPNHPFRSQKSQFNGKEETGFAPRRLTGTEVLNKISNIENTFGKSSGKKRKRDVNESTSFAWSKRSILFELPYWKDHHVRHNLDVMHVEKNVTENIFATIMGVKEKTKDGLAARKDLMKMKFRQKQWPIKDANGKVFIPKAPFCISHQERQLICQTLNSLKVPIGYSANWKHNICLEEFQLKSLKSHDYHILMQHLLPVLLMYIFKEHKPLRIALRQLSLFFNVICSKVIDIIELSKMKAQVVEILCVFEKYFPPSFFVSMIHLLVHLADETLMCGPVRYRWMYPFERMMKTYKSYVGNQTYPEGCIAERYLMQESMSYCMEYMSSINGEGTHKAGQRMLDDDEGSTYTLDKKGKIYTLDDVQYVQVRRWILQSSPEHTDWDRRYKRYISSLPTRGHNRRAATDTVLNYIPWLKIQLEHAEMSQFKRLVNGPSFTVISYTSYAIKGYIFCTHDSEKNLSTQNSGVSMVADTEFKSCAKDKNPVLKSVTHYGVLKQILELNYYDFKQVVFFCDWIRPRDYGKGCVFDSETNLTYVNFAWLKPCTNKDEEPFILASEAQQVFYVKDFTRDKWHVVLDSPKRLNRDVDAYEDPLVFEARTKTNDFETNIIQDVTTDNETDAEDARQGRMAQ